MTTYGLYIFAAVFRYHGTVLLGQDMLFAQKVGAASIRYETRSWASLTLTAEGHATVKTLLPLSLAGYLQ